MNRKFRFYLLINLIIFRSTLLPSGTEQKEMSDLDEQLGTSPPLELRRVAGQRAVPHSLQSPQDRATGKINCFFIKIN